MVISDGTRLSFNPIKDILHTIMRDHLNMIKFLLLEENEI